MLFNSQFNTVSSCNFVKNTYTITITSELSPYQNSQTPVLYSSVADPYHFDTDPDPGCGKIR